MDAVSPRRSIARLMETAHGGGVAVRRLMLLGALPCRPPARRPHRLRPHRTSVARACPTHNGCMAANMSQADRAAGAAGGPLQGPEAVEGDGGRWWIWGERRNDSCLATVRVRPEWGGGRCSRGRSSSGRVGSQQEAEAHFRIPVRESVQLGAEARRLSWSALSADRLSLRGCAVARRCGDWYSLVKSCHDIAGREALALRIKSPAAAPLESTGRSGDKGGRRPLAASASSCHTRPPPPRRVRRARTGYAAVKQTPPGLGRGGRTGGR